MSEPHSACEEDDYSCDGLCLPFLNVLSVDVRRETSQLVHELCRTDVEDENAKDRCTQVIMKIERQLGADHYICELVIKVLTELLRKICMLECAVELINEHIERKKSEDVGCLLLLCRIYGLFGDYRKNVEPLKKAHQLAEQDGDQLLLCLVLAKEACNVWHLKDPEEAKRKVAQCEAILEESDIAEKYDTFPNTSSGERLMDVFKTLGYIYYNFHDQGKSLHYYLKALNILEKDSRAVTQLIKLEAGIARSYLRTNKRLAHVHSTKVYEKAKSVSSNETYMTHHSLPMLHTIQKVAFSMDNAGYGKDALEMYEYDYGLGEKYLGQNHPEVARLAADTAYLCCRIHESEREAIYIQRAQAALECGTTDLSYIKLHVREISDTWNLLGMLFSSKNNFEESEKCFKEAISVNTRVYGCSHPRLTRLYNSLGYLYKRNSKFPAALNSFKKCLEINRDFNSGDTKQLKRLADQIDKVKALQKRTSAFTRKGE